MNDQQKAFRLDGPAVVSFSGGRTSGLMLSRILDANGGQLGPDVHVLFADTGHERPETYDFVRACAAAWSVPIRWVHRCTATYDDASVCWCTGGPSPYETLITERQFLPNPVTRYCTQELKIRPMKEWMLSRGYEHWTNAVGMRADEPARVARLRAKPPERWDVVCPLARAGLTVRDVAAFWRTQPFDLHLEAWEGNCDLCFLKGLHQRRRILSDRPELGDWWIRQERRTGARFRADAPSYARLREQTEQQPRFALPLLATADDDLSTCACTD